MAPTPGTLGSVRLGNKRQNSALKPRPGETVIDIDRTNPILGNPFILKDRRNDALRIEVIARYEDKFKADIARHGPMAQATENLAERVKRGENLILMCWCAPRPCHGHPLMKRIAELVERRPDAKPSSPEGQTTKPRAPKTQEPKPNFSRATREIEAFGAAPRPPTPNPPHETRRCPSGLPERKKAARERIRPEAPQTSEPISTPLHDQVKAEASTMPKTHLLALFSVAAIALFAGPALAGPFDVSWQALDPGNDWAAQIINAVFPVNSTPNCNGGGVGCTGNASNVIGQIVGQLTGFTLAIGMFFVCYLTVINIHRVAESSHILTDAMTSLGIVRIGFAAVLMLPLQSGFSEGQALVVQAAMWGIGMGRAVYNNAVQAIGPDSMTIPNPMIPGTKGTVLNLIQDELCRSLVNQATNTAATANPAVPIPAPVRTTSTYNGTITWNYSLAPGNHTDSPICGTVTLVQFTSSQPSIAGVSTDMTAQQQQILTSVTNNDIRPTVESVAQNFWQTKNVSALNPLFQVYANATSDYTNQLTQAATNITSQLRSAMQAQAQNARNGDVGLINNENQLSALGWTSAGAYYLEFARLNGQTLSMAEGLPVVNTPSFTGLSPALKTDLAPLFSSATSVLATLKTYVTTTDSLDSPGGNADLFTGATEGNDGSSMVEHVFRSLNLTEPLLHFFADQMSPSANNWSDPFGGLISLGQSMIIASVTALGLAFVATSNTGTAAATVFNVMTANWGAAAGINILHQMLQFFATPIFLAITSLLMPGLLIAYVLPMIPWAIWMAGVAGYLILVCEAIIAVPLWMLAHMTFEGTGLHGHAIRGYELLFNVVFRPTLMVLGLFLGYFIFCASSWLIRESFGIAAGFVLANGGLVTNMIGMWVLLAIYVLTHITAAILSFRMIYVVPHNLPALIGFGSHSRVDHDQFSQNAAWVGARGTLDTISEGLSPRKQQPQIGNNSGASSGQPLGITGPRNQISGPRNQTGSAGHVDSTLQASTDVSPPAEDN